MILKSHIIKLYPTQKQEQFFRQSCGTARFAYNWALNQWKTKFSAGERTSAYSLIKELTAIKRKDFPWMHNVGKTCPQYAIHNLDNAFKRFFKKTSKYPKFKKKGIKDSFVSVETYHSFKQRDYKFWVPRLGWVKCAENLRFDGRINYVTIKRTANLWFAIVSVTLNETPVMCENQAIVGVDLGIKSLAVTSNGLVFENPKALKSSLRLLKRRQRKLSKKMRGSNNKKKQQMIVARTHYKVSCVRKNAIHQATNKIVDSAGIIVLEDLNAKGMIRNRNLAQAIGDVSFGEFRRQIEYKAKASGKQVIIADSFFASSKTCSCCGWKNKDLKLSDRIFICLICNFTADRDLNASINLANYGSALKLRGSNACGDGSSFQSIGVSPSVKQEIVSFDKNLTFKTSKL